MSPPRSGGRGRSSRPAFPASLSPRTRGALMQQPDRRITATFLRWTFARAVFHRGYVLVSSLYFVINAHLSGYQLLLLATTMSITLVLSDIPLGVWSDAFSRKWPLVIG